jgi:hypothetical protein
MVRYKRPTGWLVVSLDEQISSQRTFPRGSESDCRNPGQYWTFGALGRVKMGSSDNISFSNIASVLGRDQTLPIYIYIYTYMNTDLSCTPDMLATWTTHSCNSDRTVLTEQSQTM